MGDRCVRVDPHACTHTVNAAPAARAHTLYTHNRQSGCCMSHNTRVQYVRARKCARLRAWKSRWPASIQKNLNSMHSFVLTTCWNLMRTILFAVGGVGQTMMSLHSLLIARFSG